MTIPSQTNPVCVKCGLWKKCTTPFMESDGSKKPEIIVVGEAPGAEEDQEGVPFVGKSGKLLREALEEVGFDMTKIRYTNVVRCRPENNEKPDKKYIDYCSQFAIQDIEEFDPPMVFLMGNSPLNGVLGESGISNWNGVKIEKDRTYVPLFHPAYILRNRGAIDEWLSAMMRVLEDDAPEQEQMEIIIPRTLADIDEMYDYLYEYEVMAFDTETNSLDPYIKNSKLLSISFAAGEKAYAYPLQHRESWWTEKEFQHILKITRRILETHDGNLVGHNIKFDLMHIYAHFKLTLRTLSDSMLISQLLDSRPGIHALKRLAGIHLGMYKYDQELRDYCKLHKEADPERGGSYDFVPLEILLPYGAKDAEATILLDEKLYPLLSPMQDALYRENIIPLSDALVRMQCNGFKIDEWIATRYMFIYNYRRSEIYEEILQDPMVKKMTKFRQKKILEKWNGPGKNGKIVKHKSTSKPPVYTFNPNSPDQVAALLYKYYHLEPLEFTDTNKPSVSKDALKPYVGKVHAVRSIQYYGLLSDMISTYLKPAALGYWVSEKDGRARSTYNIGGAITGRISSSDPHLQNIPAIESNPGTLLETLPIKNEFVPSYGNWLLSVDYSGMELRVFASIAHCVNMLKIIKSKKDTHSMIAITSMTHKPIEEITDKEIEALPRSTRYIYKWTSWTLIFGGDEYTLSRLYDIPIDDAKKTVKTYFDTFPETIEYKKACAEFAKDHGYIESPLGRKEYLPYIDDNDPKKRARSIREAINMPVQSAAWDTLSSALVIVDKVMLERQLMSMLVNTVHDSMMADTYPEEVYEMKDLCVNTMENIKVIARHYMPSIDFSWLISPLKADAEIGKHYGNLKPFEEWEKEYGTTESERKS